MKTLRSFLAILFFLAILAPTFGQGADPRFPVLLDGHSSGDKIGFASPEELLRYLHQVNESNQAMEAAYPAVYAEARRLYPYEPVRKSIDAQFTDYSQKELVELAERATDLYAVHQLSPGKFAPGLKAYRAWSCGYSSVPPLLAVKDLPVERAVPTRPIADVIANEKPAATQDSPAAAVTLTGYEPNTIQMPHRSPVTYVGYTGATTETVQRRQVKTVDLPINANEQGELNLARLTPLFTVVAGRIHAWRLTQPPGSSGLQVGTEFIESLRQVLASKYPSDRTSKVELQINAELTQFAGKIDRGVSDTDLERLLKQKCLAHLALLRENLSAIDFDAAATAINDRVATDLEQVAKTRTIDVPESPRPGSVTNNEPTFSPSPVPTPTPQTSPSPAPVSNVASDEEGPEFDKLLEAPNSFQVVDTVSGAMIVWEFTTPMDRVEVFRDGKLLKLAIGGQNRSCYDQSIQPKEKHLYQVRGVVNKRYGRFSAPISVTGQEWGWVDWLSEHAVSVIFLVMLIGLILLGAWLWNFIGLPRATVGSRRFDIK